MIKIIYVNNQFHIVNYLLLYLIIRLQIIVLFILEVIILQKLLGESILKNINILILIIMKWVFFYHQ